MKTIQFGLAEKYDKGRYCSIAVHGLRAIEVHNSELGSDLWFHLGIVDGATVHWGKSQKYGKGYHPMVALNSSGQVVELHQSSHSSDDSLYCRLGDLSGESIQWGTEVAYDNGLQPSLAINDNGYAIAVHRGHNEILFYRLGVLEGKSICWENKSQYARGRCPKISLNNQGQVVEVHQSADSNKLIYSVGQINGQMISWGPSIEFQEGTNPAVTLGESGQIVEVHESLTNSDLAQMLGQVSGDRIQWSSVSNFDSGSQPNVSSSTDLLTAIQVHAGSSYGLWYSVGKIMDRSRYFENLLPRIQNLPLRKMVFPASHDAAMYLSGSSLLGKTQDLTLYDQLLAGSRYFDLRVDGKMRMRHSIIVGPDLEAVLKDIRRFFEEGRRELAILKFSHFEGFDTQSYQTMKEMISAYLGTWMFRSLPTASQRLADVEMSAYLRPGGSILVVVDDDWAINEPEPGFWVYRDWDSKTSSQGHLTVFDKYSNTTSLERMQKDQLQKLSEFTGVCKFPTNDPPPCDLFLLSWTLTPISGVWNYAKEANRVLGSSMMDLKSPNPRGFFPNILYLDYVQYARPAFVAEILLKQFNQLI